MDVDTAAVQDFANFNLDFTNLKEECVENPEEPRFGLEVEESEIQALIESQENKNTKKNTQWALNIFESWLRERNAQGQGQELIIPEIQTMDAVQLNFYLGRFIMRVRRKDGKEYPAKTLFYISCGILRYLRDHGTHDKILLDAGDPRFADFRKILHSKIKDALSRGVGGKRKQADPILSEDETTIWERGVFGMNNAETFQNTVFFYCCKFFGPRGHDEHHSLECNQFLLGEDNRGKYIEFTGRSTKTFKGGLAHKELHNKQIRHYCQPGKLNYVTTSSGKASLH
ncbi:zinc finger MYM-type protein 2-like [Ostrea edulis]|uniref:zinc finger MYM-type protein 2-like n=1 Tax=Ostrea edulis TaxID=37623 RepID=UPI0024AF896C|nr:zinc finger MYM-type protein 2-like [Ostrea edulis]